MDSLPAAGKTTVAATAAAAAPACAVVIGASAGGVEAVGGLLSLLPEQFAPAVAIVLHVPATGRSALANVFAYRCRLPVKEAEDKEDFLGGRVYVAPPDYHLLVEPDRTLSLSQEPPVNFSRPAIDLLFETAALAYREQLLGILLTGANTDGAEGLRILRACGGTAWVQDPQDAVAGMMPSTAIARAGADEILSLHDIGKRLARVRPGRGRPQHGGRG